jgi:hypothetical protein
MWTLRSFLVILFGSRRPKQFGQIPTQLNFLIQLIARKKIASSVSGGYSKGPGLFAAIGFIFLASCTVPLQQKTFEVSSSDEAVRIREGQKNKRGAYHIIQQGPNESKGTTIINW